LALASAVEVFPVDYELAPGRLLGFGVCGRGAAASRGSISVGLQKLAAGLEVALGEVGQLPVRHE